MVLNPVGTKTRFFLSLSSTYSQRGFREGGNHLSKVSAGTSGQEE